MFNIFTPRLSTTRFMRVRYLGVRQRTCRKRTKTQSHPARIASCLFIIVFSILSAKKNERDRKEMRQTGGYAGDCEILSTLTKSTENQPQRFGLYFWRHFFDARFTPNCSNVH